MTIGSVIHPLRKDNLMISIHPDYATKIPASSHVSSGWRCVNVRDMDRIAKGICIYPWSPIIWRNGARSNKNFIQAAWLVLDFDDGETSIEQAVENIFCDYIHIIGTTKSHRVAKDNNPPCDRFRVIIPFERVVKNIVQYKDQIDAASSRYTNDQKCNDGARFFNQCREIVSINKEGFVWEIEKPIKRRSSIKTIKKYHEAGVFPPEARFILENKMHKGHRNDSFYSLGRLLKYSFNEDEIFDMAWKRYLENGYQDDLSIKREMRNAVWNGVFKTKQ